MFHLEGIDWFIYFISLLCVMLLASTRFAQIKAKYKSGFFYVKRILLGIFIITTAYWILTFPYVGWSYDFSDEHKYEKAVDSKSLSSNIEKNTHRIKILERELEETHENLREVTGRINLLLSLFMYGLIMYGSSWIFKDFGIKKE